MESNDKLEQLLKQMYAQESLYDDDIDTSDIVDEEWTKFEAEYYNGEVSESHRPVPLILKIAAMFIGALMLSGIAYATIHIIQSNSRSTQEEQTVVTAGSQLSTINSQLAEQDSTLHKPVVYEDAELATILYEMTTFYQCEVVYKSEASKHIRLYFTWDQKATIDELIGTFNKFERIHITRENKKLFVE